MPILVEADSTTAGVLMTTLPAGSPVVSRPDDVEGLLTGRGHSAVAIGPTLRMPSRPRSPSASAPSTPPPASS